MEEKISEVQEYFAELWDAYVQSRKDRNPSDRKFAKWLNVGEAALNHWINGGRQPDLVSCIKISKALAARNAEEMTMRKKAKKEGRDRKDLDLLDAKHIFKVTNQEPITVAPSRELELVIDYWEELPAELRAEVDEHIRLLDQK